MLLFDSYKQGFFNVFTDSGLLSSTGDGNRLKNWPVENHTCEKRAAYQRNLRLDTELFDIN